MRKLRGFLVIATATVGLTLGTQVTFAQAAWDQTPPVLTVPVKPAFVVGNILAAPDIPPPGGDPTDLFTNGIDQLLTWSATDNVGVSYYATSLIIPACELPVTDPGVQPRRPDTCSATGTDYDGEFGCGSCFPLGFLVTASDQQGNATTKAIPLHLRVTQENNAAGVDAVSPYGRFTYTGTWSTTNCLCFLQGHAARTSSYGARATFTRTYEQGDHVALVMAKGPGRGRAAIRVDGIVVSTIDTFASVNTNRVVVFERMMSAGTHTVSITNLATAGRPRIDLDAAMTN